MTDEDGGTFLTDLRHHVGVMSEPSSGRTPVELPAIQQWCATIGDTNPNYTDEAHATRGPNGRIVAPPMMLGWWTGSTSAAEPGPVGLVHRGLASAGFTRSTERRYDHQNLGVVYVGDHLQSHSRVLEIGDEAHDPAGVGHHVVTETTFRNQRGDLVGTITRHVFHSRPIDRPEAVPREQPKRPRPSMNADSAFFWEGCNGHELRVQTFRDGTKVFPPMVRNPRTGEMPTSPEWTVASGRATLYSYAVPHHPQVPPFDYPLLVGLVELDEGVRMVSNIVDCTREQLQIGMPLTVCWLQADENVVLPQFRPALPTPRATTARFGEVHSGDTLPLSPLPISDVTDVASLCALAHRYLSEWAGPDAVLKALDLHLDRSDDEGAVVTFSGTVTDTTVTKGEGLARVAFTGGFRGETRLRGDATLALPLDTPVGS